MPAPFAAEVLVASDVLAATFGESWQLLPMIKQADRNAPVVPDSSRPQTVFLARLHTPRAKVLITNAYDVRTDLRPGAAADHPLLRIQPSALLTDAFGAPIVLVVQAEDCVVQVETGVRWRVSSARTTTNGVRECIVNLV